MRTLPRIGLATLLVALVVPSAAIAGQGRGQIARGPGWDEGYRRGLQVGEQHARGGSPSNVTIAFEYRQGDLGYRPSYGSRDRYRIAFRLGFEFGYRAGYDRYRPGRRSGPPPWSDGRGYGPPAHYDPAYANGFEDGYRAGFEDGRDRDRFDPIGEGRYRSGDHGYERSYGPRDEYKARYREAFRAGYEEGYADSWRWLRH
jgi:hypothetical protein